MSQEYMINCVHKVAKCEGFIDYKIDTNAGSSHGDNLLGVLVAVTLCGTKRDNDKPEKLHLVCKIPPANTMRKKNFKSYLVFEREIWMYSELLPTFVKFQREKGLNETDSFVSFPKVFLCEANAQSGDYILIMEDLRPQNFVMWPKELTIPLDHELLMLRELGKFHGISFAFKDQHPNKFDKFKDMEDIALTVAMKSKLRIFFQRCVDRATNVLKNPEHKKLMLNFRDRIEQSYEQCAYGAAAKEFGIILHGDCWNNNFLFQYHDNDPKKLKAISILDWQAARCSSPALDVLYAIFTGSDKSLRDQHFDTLLNAYYSSMCETIRKLGSDPEKLFTFENLQSQLRKFGEHILLFGPVILSVRMAKAENMENLDEYAERMERDEDADLLNDYDDETQTEFTRLVNDLITDLVNYCYV